MHCFDAARLSVPRLRRLSRHFASAGRMPAPLFLNPFRPRQARAGEARRGGAMDRAEFAVRAGMHGRQTPQRVCAVPRARCARDQGREGAVLFGGFLLGEQEKATGPQGCGTNAHGREPVLAKANTTRTTQTFGASRNPRWRGCGTNRHGRQPVLAKANTTRTTQTFGASRNSQPQGCGTNRHGRQPVLAKANTIGTTQTFGASRNPQWRGCGTNAHGRDSAVAQTHKPK